jgi:hypothetical protein
MKMIMNTSRQLHQTLRTAGIFATRPSPSLHNANISTSRTRSSSPLDFDFIVLLSGIIPLLGLLDSEASAHQRASTLR